jgi:hypothetical protein
MPDETWDMQRNGSSTLKKIFKSKPDETWDMQRNGSSTLKKIFKN